MDIFFNRISGFSTYDVQITQVKPAVSGLFFPLMKGIDHPKIKIIL